MDYSLLKEALVLIESFESRCNTSERIIYTSDIEGFKHWIFDNYKEDKTSIVEPYWEGKENGRSEESVICTLLVHLSRYAKLYSKASITNSGFSTQDEFSYLINLKAFGAMTKIDLIKKNVHEKSIGIQVINRLIREGWVHQTNSILDKRSKMINITESGLDTLSQQMDKIRIASKLVAGNLTDSEKLVLIQLLTKLDFLHNKNYLEGVDYVSLLTTVNDDLS